MVNGNHISHTKQHLGGAHYLSKGFSLIWKKGIRAYVFIPLFINMLLLTAATIYAFGHITQWYDSLATSDNFILVWIVENLDWLLWPIIVICVLIVVFFSFAFLANWVAAPFNGLLAESVERHLAGNKFKEQSFSWGQFTKDVPRLFAREFRKFLYYFPRALGCLLLFVTPLAFLAPVVWFVFNAWMASIQYLDYPMDNHRIPFNDMLAKIRERRSLSFGFGGLVMFFTMIPVVNIFLMPVAVAGATALWYERFADDY